METDNKTIPVSPQQDQNQISLDLMKRMKMGTIRKPGA